MEKEKHDKKKKNVQKHKDAIEQTDKEKLVNIIQSSDAYHLQKFLQSKYDKLVDQSTEHVVLKAIDKKISDLKNDFDKNSLQRCIMLFKKYYGPNVKDQVILKIISGYFENKEAIDKCFPNCKWKQAKLQHFNEAIHYKIIVKNTKTPKISYLIITFNYKGHDEIQKAIYCGKMHNQFETPSFKRMRKQAGQVLVKIIDLKQRIQQQEENICTPQYQSPYEKKIQNQW